MNSLRIVFMGSPDFAVPTLDSLHNSNHQIVAVVSGEDKRRTRRGEPEPSVVKKKATELGIKTIDADSMRDPELENQLRQLEADLFVVVAFKILPESLLKIPDKGAINLHASLLPKYRGAAPIHWAIINGEEETGCTVFFLNKEVDTGNIIAQEKTKIGPGETTGDLYERLKKQGADLIVQSVNQIAEGSVETKKQNNLKATPAPKLYRENTAIDFDKPASDVHNLVRGLNPFPVAWCMYSKEKMNVYETSLGPNLDLAPGELTIADDRLIAGTNPGSVELKTIQLPGRKKMSGIEFANGYSIDENLTSGISDES